MVLRDFRVGWRLLLKEPAYSLAVVGGLALGLAVCFLLLGYVRFCLSYNAAIADSARVYVVKERRNMLPRPDWRPTAPLPLRDVASSSGPGATATSSKAVDVAARIDNRVLPLTVDVADANFLAFFGITAIEGDAQAALARPDALVLSRQTAARLFGTDHALGKRLHIDGQAFEVRAILADQPANTTVRVEALVGAGAHSWDDPEERSRNPWFSAAAVYVKLPPGADAAALAGVLQAAVSRERDAKMGINFRRAAGAGRLTDIAVVSLADMYFDPGLLAGRNGARYGSKMSVAGLAALAAVIVLLAVVNYVNLATVRMLVRQREIGIRKVLGVSPARLAAQFVAESLLASMLATMCAMLLAWIVLPLFSTLVDRPLGGMFTVPAAALMLAFGAAVGIASALYPAWLALRQPVGVGLQGRAGSESAQGLLVRRVLSAFQFAVAIALVAATLTVSWQARYASRADPGFDAKPLLLVALPGDPASATAHAFRTALSKLPNVRGVTTMSEAVGRDDFKMVGMIGRPGGTPLPVELRRVGPEFFEVYGVRAVAGRLFDPARDTKSSDLVVINTRAAAAFGFAPPEAAIGQLIGEQRVAGVAPDLRYQNLRQAPQALTYNLDPDQRMVTIRTDGNMAALQEQVAALWSTFYPNDMADIEAASAVFADNYREDARLASLLAGASVVATGLAAFGIYVLSAYSVRRRAREIVLRKLHGATSRDVGRLIGREFIVLVGIGALAGLPPAWLAAERYLAGFVERAPMGYWPQLAALLAVCSVALAATTRHALGAMRMSPALALRDT